MDKAKIVLTEPARRDIRRTLKWSEEQFGKSAALRYQALILQAIQDVGVDPLRPGARQRPDLQDGIFLYHLSASRDISPANG